MEWGITEALPCVLGTCALTGGGGVGGSCELVHFACIPCCTWHVPLCWHLLGCVGHTLLFPPMHAMSCEYPELFSAGSVVLCFVGRMS